MADVAENRVAVYIDFDNIVISRYNQLHGRGAFQSDRVRDLVVDDPRAAPAVVERADAATVDIGALLDFASSFGTIVISRAYADWSQPVNAGYRRQLIDRAIDLTQMFPLSATKNGADIRLAIDVVEDMFRLGDVTHVVLVAGDSDYVALAQRVKRLGRFFVAIGVAGATSRSLPAACNDFSLYDDLPGIGADEEQDVLEPDGAEPGTVAETGTVAEPHPVAETGTVAEPHPVAEPGPVAEPHPVAEPVEAPTHHEAKTGTVAEPGPVAEPVEAAGKRTARGRASRKAGPPSDAAPRRSVPEVLPPEEEPAAAGEPAVKMSPRAATRLLRRALELAHDKAGGDEWLDASVIKQQIKRLDPSFHEKSLGYASFGDFVKSRNNLAEVEKAANGQRVRARPVED